MDSTETISSGQNKQVRHRLARGVSAADNKQILAHAERVPGRGEDLGLASISLRFSKTV